MRTWVVGQFDVSRGDYTASMLERTQTRMLPVINRANEHAPMAAACCNACRTCWTSNIFGLIAAFGAGVLAFVTRRRTQSS
jgi:hypothetical protein